MSLINQLFNSFRKDCTSKQDELNETVESGDVDTLPLHSVYTSYYQLMKDIVSKGHSYADTKCLVNTAFTLQHDAYVNSPHDKLLLTPAVRCNGDTSLRYGLAEAAWYMAVTRDPEMIIPYGRIWDKMRGPDGLVNSNYGYQLMTNNDFDAVFNHLTSHGSNDGCLDKSVTVTIASGSNMHDKFDTVCNNLVRVHFTETADAKGIVNIDATSIARSIDVIYGLPYDIFALQGFVYLLTEKLDKLYSDGKFMSWLQSAPVFRLRNITIAAANMHMYNRHLLMFDEFDSKRDSSRDDNMFAWPVSLSAYRLGNLNQSVIDERYADMLDLADVSRAKQELTKQFKPRHGRSYRQFLRDCDNNELLDTVFSAESQREAVKGDRKQFMISELDNEISLYYCVPDFVSGEAKLLTYCTERFD